MWGPGVKLFPIMSKALHSDPQHPWDAEASGSLSSRLAWSIDGVPGPVCMSVWVYATKVWVLKRPEGSTGLPPPPWRYRWLWTVSPTRPCLFVCTRPKYLELLSCRVWDGARWSGLSSQTQLYQPSRFQTSHALALLVTKWARSVLGTFSEGN